MQEEKQTEPQDLENENMVEQGTVEVESGDIQEPDTEQLDATQKSAEDWQKDIDAANDKYLRLQAEMVNYKNRQEKMRLTWKDENVKEVLQGLLEPLDNLQRTLETAEQSEDSKNLEQLKSFIEGIQMVSDQFHESMKKFGVVKVDPTGEKFNPTEHEAMGQIEDPEIPNGHVARVFRQGYKLNERCIRTALVQISKSS